MTANTLYTKAFTLIIILILLSLIPVQSSAQPVWDVISPRPVAGDVYSIDFTSPDSGWIVSRSGQLARTTDAGRSWRTITQPNLSNGDWALDAVDGQRVFLIGGYDRQNPWLGKVYSTPNGGEDWHDWSLGSDFNPFNPTALAFISPDLGWVAGMTSDGGAQRPSVYRYTGGNSFEQVILPAGIGVTLNDIFFLNSSLGWVVGTLGYAAYTINGGRDWDTIYTGTTIALHSVYFTTPAIGYITGGNFNSGVILRTVNNGESWDWLQSPADSRILKIRPLFDGGLIAITNGGEHPARVLTTNNGIQWHEPFSTTTYNLLTMSTIGNTIRIGGTNGLVLLSSNRFQNWSEASTRLFENTVWSISFIDDMRGWATGSGGIVQKTEDGGSWWESHTVADNINLYAVCFYNDQIGYTAGSGSREFVTSNGGIDWREINIGNGIVNRIDISFGGRFYASHNYSVSTSNFDSEDWNSSEVMLPGNIITGLSVASDDIAYVCSPTDSLRRTLNGGEDWNRVTAPFTGCIDVHFINSLKGWVAAIEAGGIRVYSTSDGAINWTPLARLLMNPVRLRFADETTGWLWGSSGELMMTTDGGNRWVETGFRSRNIIRDMTIHSANRMWLCGEGSLVARWGSNWLSTPANLKPPASSQLLAAWPNPTNGWLNISLPYSMAGLNLSLYDLHGRYLSDIHTSGSIMNGFVTISLNNLPDGVYYLKTQSTSSLPVRVVLLK